MKISEKEWGTFHKIITEVQETYLTETETKKRSTEILHAHGFLRLRQKWDVE